MLIVSWGACPLGFSGEGNRSMRARDLGITIGRGSPGRDNAITDVAGVRVGHTTLIEGGGPLRAGHGPVRTGVTVIVPTDEVGHAPIFAGCHRLNGNGEMTGLEWVRESGMLGSPIALTNTHSVGIVRDALVAAPLRHDSAATTEWSLPVVGETWDGLLNDINGMHVRREHVWRALDLASSGPVAEGNVGGGTGMICHEFKGGIGTSSRVIPRSQGGFTVGVLVQANYGRRERLCIMGVPVGDSIPVSDIPAPTGPPSGQRTGSIIGVVATDAPLLPHQCRRLAQRVGLGIARVGGVADHSSGDLFIAFATGNADVPSVQSTSPTSRIVALSMLADAYVTPLYDAVVDATEEAIINALVAARTMTGRDNIEARALPHELVKRILSNHGRLRF